MDSSTPVTLVEDFAGADQSPISTPWTSNPTGLGAARRVSNTLAATGSNGEAVHNTSLGGAKPVGMGVTVSTAGNYYVGLTDQLAILEGYILGFDGLYRFDDNDPVQIVAGSYVATAGDQMWVLYTPATGLVEAWRNRAGTWTLLASATDTTYAARPNWYIWLGPWATATRLDNVYKLADVTLAGPIISASRRATRGLVLA